MKQVAYVIATFLCIVWTIQIGNCQQLNVDFESNIDALASEVDGLNDKVKINVGQSTLQTFISGLAHAHSLNIIVDPGLDMPITANFSNETVINVLKYLVNQYQINVVFTGTIMSFSKKKEDPVLQLLKITYDKNKDRLSYDLKNENLTDVTKEIAFLSQKNIVIDPVLVGKKVNGFITQLSLKSSLNKLALANEMTLSELEDGTYFFTKKGPEVIKKVEDKPNQSSNTKDINLNTKDIILTTSEDVNGEILIGVSAIDKSVSDIIKYVFHQIGLNYIFFTEPNEKTTLEVKEMPLESLLSYLLNATDYTFKNHGDLYSFGLRSNEQLRNTKVVKLEYRSLTDVMAVIPPEIKNGVNIQEFPELNCLILSGSTPNINEIEKMILLIDKPVPVIQIELIIVDVSKTAEMSSGIEAGIGDKPVTSGGSLIGGGGLDVTLGAGTINSLLSTVGLSNLGRITPNFYVSLSAMEANGNINIRSQPKLATLNSHEATLSIGETSYYLEQQQNVIGTQNPQTVITNQFKSVNADFSITILPVVSGDEQVTLEIEVNQSTFTGRISPEAPPGQASRFFKSSIRVKNEEMIVLGGLQRTENSQTGSGLPGISRVPFFKWFFGKRQKKKEKSELLIFIKPTIVY